MTAAFATCLHAFDGGIKMQKLLSCYRLCNISMLSSDAKRSSEIPKDFGFRRMTENEARQSAPDSE